MGRVFYFNVTYYCNNDCVFCFSSSTGENCYQIEAQDLKERLKLKEPIEKEDVIVFNGGEPVLHPAFYEVLAYVQKTYEARIVVYSNGTCIDADKLTCNRVEFVIPIHGREAVHDRITQRKRSYRETVNTLDVLQKRGISFSLKFIVGTEMIHSGFQIADYLDEQGLRPERVILARLNVTAKSIKNGVTGVPVQEYAEYVNRSFKMLRQRYRVMFLDTPPCILEEFQGDTIVMPEALDFYFNDYRYDMVERAYYKQIMIMDACKGCGKQFLCKRLSTTYLTIQYEDDWKITNE